MVTVVFGGQAGSEGKGKIIGYLAQKNNYAASICNFAANAGHTYVEDDGRKVMLKHIPMSMLNTNTQLLIGPGAAIDLDVLEKEITQYKLHERLLIHPNASIITDANRAAEKQNLEYISSTLTGCGYAYADKIMRNDKVLRARDVPALETYIASTETILRDIRNSTGRNDIMVEGSQGFDLDINYGLCYPYVTSRQTNVAQLVADSGIPVTEKIKSIAVIRTYPIRVGNTFNLKGEMV